MLAGVSMYALVRVLTGGRSAGLLAGFAFAFYTLRFEHYSQLELPFAFWMPLVLLALHRTLANGRVRDGILTGLALAAQILSSLYFGILLCAYVIVVGGAAALGCARRPRLKPLLAGVGVTAALTLPLAGPYLQVSQTYGETFLR